MAGLRWEGRFGGSLLFGVFGLAPLFSNGFVKPLLEFSSCAGWTGGSISEAEIMVEDPS